MDWLLSLGLGYLLGSIPFGIILTRLTGAGDLRAVGSGSTGATNVLRTGRKDLAAATLLLDGAKGWLAVWLAEMLLGRLFPAAAACAALGAVVGHCFPVWLKFRGGKGVATMFGIALGLAWPLGLAYAVIWLSVLAVTRISSLAGMSAAMTAPVAAWLLVSPRLAPVLAVLAVLVMWQHRANIARLSAGTEPRVGFGKK